MSNEDNDWYKWRQLILSTLEKVQGEISKLRDDVSRWLAGIREDIAAVRQDVALLRQEIQNVKDGHDGDENRVEKRLETIEDHVDKLRLFQAKQLGMAAAAGAIVSLLISLGLKLIGG